MVEKTLDLGVLSMEEGERWREMELEERDKRETRGKCEKRDEMVVWEGRELAL